MDRRFSQVLFLISLAWLYSTSVIAADPDNRLVSVFEKWETLNADRGRDGWSVRAIRPFVGQVQASHLLQRFSWSFRNSQELVGTPKEALERQFMPAVVIQMDSQAIPLQVSVGQQIYQIRDLVLHQVNQIAVRESLDHQQEIVRVSFESESSAPVGARLNQILTKWCQASLQAKAVRLQFSRVDYDTATEVESHSKGNFVFSSPHSGSYHLVPTVTAETKSTRVGIHGTNYAVVPRDEYMLLWRDKDLVQIENHSRSYQVYERPGVTRDVLGSGSFDATWQTLISPQTALPFVVGLSDKDMRKSFDWELIADQANAIVLHGTPVVGPDAFLYSHVQVVINPLTWRTQATRMIDSTTSRETMHEFQYLLDSDNVQTLGHWEPELSHYQKVAAVPGVEAVSDEAMIDSIENPLPAAPPAEGP